MKNCEEKKINSLIKTTFNKKEKNTKKSKF